MGCCKQSIKPYEAPGANSLSFYIVINSIITLTGQGFCNKLA